MLDTKLNGIPVSLTATHATLAVCTIAAVPSIQNVLSSLSVSSDKAGSIVLVKDGTTVIWQAQVGAGYFNMSFPEGLFGTQGNLLSVEIDGTSACKANMNVVKRQFRV